MGLPINFNPSQPIPNGPFYSAPSYYLQGVTGPLVIGAGLNVNFASGTLSATGGGGSAGTVTSVATGAGLTGGPITGSGTISLTNTAVTPGTYTFSTITVDANGRLTAASSGAAPVTGVIGTPPITVTGTTVRTISIASASTTSPGAVQLFNGVNNTSTTLALTAAQGKNLQDQISALTVASNLTLAGTFDAASGLMLTVTNDGTTAGFAVGSALPTPSATTDNHFVITTVAGTYNPPGPSGPFTLTAGDWLLSSATDWSFLDVGATLAYATTTTAGTVCLSTNALAQAGADTLTALTPATARSAFVPNVCYALKGDLVGGSSAANTPVALGIGTAGQILTVDSTAATGFAWKAPATSGTVTNVATGTGLTGGPITSTGTIALTNTAVTAGSYTYASLTVDAQGRLTAASSGAAPNTTVTAPITNSGTTVAPVIGLANTAVTPGSYTLSNITVDAQGRITAASSGTPPAGGTVTSVATGTGLTGGPITSTGTIALANTAVTPGPYTNGSFTVDAQGRLTAASSGAAPVTSVTGTTPIAVTAGATPVVSIAAASTTAPGAVQLNNTVASTSTTQALTAAQGKVLQDQITTLLTTPGIDLAGTIDASTGFVASVTSVGSTAGYTVGSVLPAADATTVNTYVVVTTPGTLTPPGGSATAATRGDWFLASETAPGVYSWQFLNVGFDAPAATDTVAGIVELATNAETQTGTDTTRAVTPAGAAATYVPLAGYTAKGALLAATGANTPVALTVGTDGQSLVACAACTTGLTWANITIANATPTVAGKVLGCTISNNTALGCNALLANTSFGNTAVGVSALTASTTGDNNVAVGNCALVSNTSASNNTALGAFALTCVTTGGFNTAVGRNALAGNLTGCGNIAMGHLAGCSLTAGINNSILGNCAGDSITTGNFNVLLGASAGCSISTGIANIAIGTAAGCSIQGDYNVFLGNLSGSSTTAGDYNVALGSLAHGLLTTGTRNVAIGPNVNVTSPTGSCQLAIGFSNAQNWLTGDSSKNIRPGASIIDCTGSAGLANQVLSSTGSALAWYTLPGAAALDAAVAFTLTSGTMCQSGISLPVVPGSCGVAITASINSCGWLNTSTGRFTPTVAGYYQANATVSAQSSVGNVWAGVLRNGIVLGQAIASCTGSGQWLSSTYSTVVYLNGTTDYLQLGGAAQNMGTPAYACADGLTTFSAGLLGASTTAPASYQIAQFPNWISAGTVQSVGIATVNNPQPTIGTTTQNNIRYRQIGPKEWEVQGVLYQTGNSSSGGNGDLLFTLPAGLQFDTSSPFQQVYTGIALDSAGWLAFLLPGSQAIANRSGAGSYSLSGASPYDATRYRIALNGPSNAYWSSGYYSLAVGNPSYYKWSFTFTTP